MTDKFVLYLGGGSMSGIFGAGIVTRLQEENVYDKIESIFCASAGAFNGAYFLSKQTELGSSIYYEDLIDGFIFPWKILSGTSQRFWDRYVKSIEREKIHNPINIDFLMDVSRNKKILDVDAVKNNSIPTYAKVFDLEEDKIKYVDLKNDVFKSLKEAVSVVPYYFPPKDQNNIDGGLIERIGFDCLKNNYSNSKIVFCINCFPKLDFKRNLRHSLEGTVTSFMYENSSIKYLLKNEGENFMQDVEKIRGDKKSLLIHPPQDNPTNNGTTNPDKLRATWKMGKKEAEKILEFIT